jgi:hypothetical protein
MFEHASVQAGGFDGEKNEKLRKGSVKNGGQRRDYHTFCIVTTIYSLPVRVASRNFSPKQQKSVWTVLMY